MCLLKMMFYLSIFIKSLEARKCLSSYCIENHARKNYCEVCTSVKSDVVNKWHLYIKNYYPDLKLDMTKPMCCNSGADGFCLSHRIKNDGKHTVSLECSRDDKSFPLLQKSVCNLTHRSNLQCCTSDYCNIFSGLIPYPTDEISQNFSSRYKSIFVIVGLIVIFILTSLAYLIFYLYRKHVVATSYCVSSNEELKNGSHAESIESGIVVSRSEKREISSSVHNIDILLSDIWSGSGKGTSENCLTNRCLLNDVTMLEKIGQGRFGEVWRGKWSFNGDVAVKMFHTVEERSWTRERFIFRLDLFSHDNILHFIGSDTVDEGSCTRLCLITEYHSMGSLYNYLQTECIPTIRDLMAKCLDIATGLAYLHTEISSNEHKPAIAHRDLKSANILVKSSGKLCLADFTSSICSYSCGTTKQGTCWYRECSVAGGTIRYAAPEVLNGSVLLNHNSLLLSGLCLANWDVVNSYQKADVYSLALVYWEMINMWNEFPDRITSTYRKPYSDLAPDNPSLEHMLKIIDIDNKRPEIKSIWYQGQTASLCRIITECWSPRPSYRLTSSNVKKQLSKQLFIL